jgi:phosphoribosylpyrophosphate synthetase
MKEHKNRFTSWLREHDIPDEKTIEEHTIKVLALDHHARSRHGKPMTLVASHTVPSPRTKRACHRTVEFDVTPYTLKLVRKLHTLASLRIYGN